MTDHSGDIMLLLEIGIFIALFFQPSQSRLYTGTVFLIMLILHERIFSTSDGLVYYGTAALCYLGIMILTAPAINVTKLVLDIHKICLIAIMVNATGWIAWYAYLPPNLYNLASVILHVWGVWALMQRTGSKDNEFRTDWRDINFRFNRTSWNNYISQHKGKI